MNGQLRFYNFHSTDDGKLFCWVNEDVQNSGITICTADSLSYASSSLHPTIPMQTRNARLSGDGNFLFWHKADKWFRTKFRNGELSDTVPIEYPGGLSNFAFDVNYDGSELLASYDAPTLPKRCSPGFRMLLHFAWNGERYVMTDTLSPPDTCSFVHTSHILPNGFVFLTTFNNWHLLQPGGNGKFHEINFVHNPPVHRPSFLVPQNGNSIFITGYTDDPLAKGQDSIFVLYECRYQNGVYSEPIFLHEWRNSPYWSTAVNVSPNGKHLLWSYLEKDKARINPDVVDVYSMEWSNGNWSEPTVLFSEVVGPSGRTIGNGSVISNSNAVWIRQEGQIVFCNGLKPGATVMNISLLGKQRVKYNALYSGEIRVHDTLIEKEQAMLELHYVNTYPETLMLTPYIMNYYPRGYERVVPVAPNAWAHLSPDFQELSAINGRTSWTIAPGDSCVIPLMIAFTASGEKQYVSLYARGKTIMGVLEWDVIPDAILKDTRRSPYEVFVGANGKKREQCERTRQGFILRSWYPNGQERFEASYDDKSNPNGTWKYFSENGVLLEEKSYRSRDSYTVKTWFANGQLRSEGSFRKTCKTGRWNEYYEDGHKKSVAKFRRVWTLNIYLGTFGMDVTMGTYAHSYDEYYRSGRKQLHVQYGMSGRPKGTWEAWYENGNRNAVKQYGHNRTFKEQLYNTDGTLCYDSETMKSYPLPACTNLLAPLPQLIFEQGSRRSHYRGNYF